MKCTVITTRIHVDSATPPETREIDILKAGNRKWLAGHIKWAATHSRVVSIVPES